MSISDRQSNIQKELKLNNIDLACILKPHNVLYFAGYVPVCSGILIFSDFDPIFCILSLDAPEAKQFCAMSNVTGYVFPRESLMGKMIETIKKKETTPKKNWSGKGFHAVERL